MRCKPVWLALVRASLVAGLTLSICAAGWAAGREKTHFAFQGHPERYPVGNLVFDAEGNLYGTTLGTPSTVFRFAPKPGGGWSYSEIYVFDNPSNGSGTEAGLLADNAGNLFGTTAGGGANNDGVVFELTPNSSGQWTETVLYDFEAYPGDAAVPVTNLIFDAQGNLYGTGSAGGAYGFGAVFELTPNSSSGWTESVLYSFMGPPNDGAIPLGGLLFDDVGNLYGTSATGGPGSCQYEAVFGCGTVFQLSPSASGRGWTENVLHGFLNGSDGAIPQYGASLVVDADGNLYGATAQGGGLCGSTGCGTVFEVSPVSGGAWTENVIHRFSIKDGREPEGSLVFDSAGDLYGTTAGGGAYGWGMVFQLRRNSNGEWRENGSYSFTGGIDGAQPFAGVIVDAAGKLYGTTQYGGAEPGLSGFGVLFVGSP